MGTIYPEATLTVRKKGGQQQEYLVVELKDIIISSVQTAGSSSVESVPMESISLNFSQMVVKYKPQAADGSLLPAVQGNARSSC